MPRKLVTLGNKAQAGKRRLQPSLKLRIFDMRSIAGCFYQMQADDKARKVVQQKKTQRDDLSWVEEARRKHGTAQRQSC